MILSLGPWLIDAEGRRDILLPFSTTSKPKLVMNMSAVRQVRFLHCHIPGRFYIDRFILDKEPIISGRCDTESFIALFPTLYWPLLGPGSKLDLSVVNPESEEQIFSLSFTVSTT